MSSDKKVVVITGANTGLGYEIVKALYQSPQAYEIVVGSRDIKKGEAAIEKLQGEIASSASSLSTASIDIESDDSIYKFRDHITSRFGRVDSLINNAGANFDLQLTQGQLGRREMWNKTWDVNVAGTDVLTHEFVPLLLKSADPRLIFMTSGTASLAETELTEGPMYARLNAVPAAGWPKDSAVLPMIGYRSAKTGLNMMMREWRRCLKNDGVKIWAVSPGFLATNLSNVGAEKLRQMGALDPSIGGNFVKDVIEGKRDHDEGKSIRKDSIQIW